MRQTLDCGRLFGIRVGVHVSWIPLFVLAVLSIAANLSDVPRFAALGLAALCALLLFASVVAHEFAHALVARRFAVRTSAITLFLFGGVATLEREPPSPRAEIWIALAGPAMSALLAASAFSVLALLERWPDGPFGPAAGVTLAYLALSNGLLAAFNLVPAFPLDGGRVLRAIVWRAGASRAAATAVAAIVGLVIAAGMMGAGLVLALCRHAWQTLWYTLLGAYLLHAAWRQFAQARGTQRLARARPAGAGGDAHGAPGTGAGPLAEG